MNNAITRCFLLGLLLLFVCMALFLGWAWSSVVWYPPVAPLGTDCEPTAPAWDDSQPLKVMSFNVQYMASKNYVFFYDAEGGPDTKPSREHVLWTLDRVAELIRDENPDVLFLQEVNDAADGRTHHIDQLQQLQQRLGSQAYPCSAQAHYWQAGFVLHPKVMGPVSMKLVTLSRYQITQAQRHALPVMQHDPLTERFYFQRAVLETQLQTVDRKGEDNQSGLTLLNTHFDAWGHGSDLMSRQVAVVERLIDQLEEQSTPWVLGGDLNVLPPDGGLQLQRLRRVDMGEYDSHSVLAPLYQRYGAIPALEDLTRNGAKERAQWYTFFPNDPRATGPDRTIDYLFYSKGWRLQQSYIRRRGALDVSDHLPVVGVMYLERSL